MKCTRRLELSEGHSCLKLPVRSCEHGGAFAGLRLRPGHHASHMPAIVPNKMDCWHMPA